MSRTSTFAITNQLGTTATTTAAPSVPQVAAIPQPPHAAMFQPRISEQQLRGLRSERYYNYLHFSFSDIEVLKNQYPADAELYIQRLLIDDSLYRFKELVPNNDVVARDRLIALFPTQRDTILTQHEARPYERPECVIS